MESHNFWKTQSIQDTSKKEKLNECCIISKFNDDIYPAEKTKLPEGFTWDNLDSSDKIIDEMYLFLYDNYVNGNDKYGGHYSKESLKWFLETVTEHKDLCFCVRYNNKIVGTIIGIPETISIYDKIYKISQTTFLCIDKNLRNRDLAPISIQEMCRRLYRNNILMSYYTSFLKLPNILTTFKYYFRPLNVKKLLDLNIITNTSRISINGFEKLYKVKDKITSNLRLLENKDIKQCTEKYNNYYKKYKIHQVFTENEFKHKFLPKNNIIDSFVVEKNGIITDFISIFYVKTHVFNNNKYSDYSVAQIYQYFYSDEKKFIDIVDDILYIMKQKNIDVVNCINQMDTHIFLDRLKFKERFGENNFYIWNMKCLPVNPSDIALITI